MARMIRPEDARAAMVISADPADHLAEIQRYVDLGATAVYVHNTGPNQAEWIEKFGTDVLPQVVH